MYDVGKRKYKILTFVLFCLFFKDKESDFVLKQVISKWKTKEGTN